MKNQALFSSKDKSRKIKCCLRQFLFGAFRVNVLAEMLQSFVITAVVCEYISSKGKKLQQHKSCVKGEQLTFVKFEMSHR